MYNSQNLIENIKAIAKSKNILVKEMLTDCDLNVNALNQMSDKKGISSFSLAKIADYLDVSIDYLLGRTCISEIEQIDSMTQILIKHFNKLSPQDKIDFLNMIVEKAG